MLVDMTHANEQRPAATGNAADNVSDAPTGPATSAAARPTTVTADGTTATNAAASSTAKPAASTSWARETNPRRALLTIIVTVVVVVAIVLGLGFFVNWGLAALLVIIMIPGAISLAVLAKHPESTGGRSMFGISDPNTLLDPIRRPSERRGEYVAAAHRTVIYPWGGKRPMGRFEEIVKRQNKAILGYRPMRVLPPHGIITAP